MLDRDEESHSSFLFFCTLFKLDADEILSAEICLELLSKCAYIFAVAEKLECPNHSCIAFIGIPLASNKLAHDFVC